MLNELKKVRQVITRKLPGAPHESLLVLDATTGQSGIAQAKAFGEAAGLTGIILTKMDGTSRGGIILAIREAFALPVKLIGFGEKLSDLRTFDLERYIDALTGDLEK
ncbi:unnamed protein product [Didymodactylos carnosus]|uniref:SRP54-type proteins GTP-binding domain-containing protein n=1 Tax=Didymodactylos carnosus TaxID=1234261 RepID=A0A8S2CUA3_9BILA|nr:unnamed protein product [Didymodactylos carnosus]CAF3588556.1 unnamed protein product [Didymodactylos carnosus]